MDLESLDTCNICMESYSEKIRPRVLQCGHNFCATCLTRFIISGTLECPNCHRHHRASTAQDFPINYGMEALITEMRKAKQASGIKQQTEIVTHPLSKNTTPSPLAEGKLQKVFNEQREALKKVIEAGKEMQLDLQNYMEFLAQTKEKHEELIPHIYELANRNQKLIKDINEEQAEVKTTLTKLEDHIHSAATSLSKSEEATGALILSASDDLEKCNCLLEQWSTEVHRTLPSVKTFSKSQSVLRDTIAALSVISPEEEVDYHTTFDLPISPIPIMDKLQRLRGMCTMTVPTLKSMSENVKSSIEKGHVYAVQEKEGKTRSAKLSISDGKIYLHYLADEEPPVFAHTIQHSTLIDTLKKDSTVAFFSLSRKDDCLGKLHILLSPDTELAQSFRLRCTGELGPSYVTSRFFAVKDEGNAIKERLYGGEYADSGSCGNAPLITGIDPSGREYRREATNGIVWSRFDMKNTLRSAQFGIFTGLGTRRTYDGVFGVVQDGLHLLKSKGDIRKLVVVDCGVVLPF